MSTPAGWYDDGSGRKRWWDGTQWTEHLEPSVPAPVSTDVSGEGVSVWPETKGTAYAPVQAATTVAPKAGGFAIAALVLAIVAFLTGLVPVVGAVLGLAAIGLAIAALVRNQSKGLGITSLVLAGIAVLVSLVMTMGLGGFLAGVDTESSGTQVETEAPIESEAPASSDDDAHVDEPEEEAPPVADAGEVTNPLPQPYIAKGLLGGEKYSLVARVFDASANATVQGWNMFNSEAPAGYKYVIVELSMTGIDPDGVDPSLAAWDLYLATAEGNRYDAEFIVFGDGMPSMADGPTLYPDNSFTGYTAYIVPETAESFLLYDNRKYISLG